MFKVLQRKLGQQIMGPSEIITTLQISHRYALKGRQCFKACLTQTIKFYAPDTALWLVAWMKTGFITVACKKRAFLYSLV